MDKQLIKTRLAVVTAFIVNGLMVASWVSRIPEIQVKLGMSEGTLGFVLLGMSIGVLVGLSVTGGLIARFGSHKTTLFASLAVCFSLIPLSFAPNPVTLWISLFLFGGTMSIMDVSMNDQAVNVEKRAGRPLMSSFHAAFSIGGLAGAVIGSFMAGTLAFSPLIHFIIIAFVFAIIMLLVSPNFIPSELDQARKAPAFSLPERALWMLGLVAFCSAIGEGAMADWSGIYLHNVLGTTTSVAALGFAAFSLTMTAGRFTGDYLTARWKPEAVVRFGGLAAGAGLLLVIFVPSSLIAMIGFGIVGIGLANIIPVVFSAAGNSNAVSPGAGIAGVATIGYAGFLAGPPLIGMIAEGVSMQAAFGLVAVMVGSLFLTAGAIRKHN